MDYSLLWTLIAVILLVVLFWLIVTGRIARFSANFKGFSISVDGPSRTQPTASEVEIFGQVRRFKRVMAADGMRPEQWPRFFKSCGAPFDIQLSDIKDDDSILNWLNDEKIDWLCNALLIRREWLDGEAHARPHEQFYFNRLPERFFETVTNEITRSPTCAHKGNVLAVFALDSDRQHAEHYPNVRLMIAIGIPVCRISNETTVYRWIYDDASGGYPWNEEAYQLHIRSIVRLAFSHFDMTVCGLYFGKKDFEAIDEGEGLIPEVLNKRSRRHRAWHPDDYALSKSESRVAMKTTSLPLVLTYLATRGLPIGSQGPVPSLDPKSMNAEDEDPLESK